MISAPAQLTTPAAATSWPDGMLALVPVYNHARQVGEVVRDLLALGAPLLVVDDGSTDGSGEVAAAAGAEVLRLPQNQGKAAALKAGFQAAEARGYRQVLSCDADGQHPASEAWKLALAATAIDDFYIGKRDMQLAPRISRLGRFLSNCSSRVVCGVWPGDSQSGLRVYPIPAVNRLNIPASRYAFEIEVLIRGVWAGLQLHCVDVAVIYPEDRVTHFNKLRDNAQATGTLLRLFGRRLMPIKPAALRPDDDPAADIPRD